MSRRASNAVKLARKSAAKVGTRLDRNGIPVFDKEVSRLTRRCGPGQHEFVVTSRNVISGGSDFDRVAIESRCVICREKIVETKTEMFEEA